MLDQCPHAGSPESGAGSLLIRDRTPEAGDCLERWTTGRDSRQSLCHLKHSFSQHVLRTSSCISLARICGHHAGVLTAPAYREAAVQPRREQRRTRKEETQAKPDQLSQRYVTCTPPNPPHTDTHRGGPCGGEDVKHQPGRGLEGKGAGGRRHSLGQGQGPGQGAGG